MTLHQKEIQMIITDHASSQLISKGENQARKCSDQAVRRINSQSVVFWLTFIGAPICNMLLFKTVADKYSIKNTVERPWYNQMKKMKQKKKGKKVRKAFKTTIVPKMSVSRQSYIKRFRRSIIRRANETLKEELKNASLGQTSQKSSRAGFKRKMTIDEEDDSRSDQEEERRVRFDEESNETFQNPRWIEADEQDGIDQQSIEEKEAGEEED